MVFSSSIASAEGRSQPFHNTKLDDLDYKILELHENVKNPPVFG